MIIADYSNTDDVVLFAKSQLFQYDEGQHLNILGLSSENFKQVKFTTDLMTYVVTDIEEITNGFRVAIPNAMLSETGHYKDYWITAYISFTDGGSIKSTIKVVRIYVKLVQNIDDGVVNISSINNLTVSDDDNGNIVIG